MKVKRHLLEVIQRILSEATIALDVHSDIFHDLEGLSNDCAEAYWELTKLLQETKEESDEDNTCNS